jgi:acyl-CoA synthetase (AMP-forming)/AMP-acid ligase II/NAD(P)-dependent dehydrogenase (short-subunit alcohol dehydrogenase family)
MSDRPRDLEPEALVALERAAAAVPGVRRAVALPRYRAVTPAARRGAGERREAVAATAEAPPAPARPRPPALADGGPLDPGPGHPRTLQDALRRAAADGAGRGVTYVLTDGATVTETYAGLLARAQRVLRGLRDAGVRPGESVLLQLDDARGFVGAFWACVLGGFLPAPVGVARDHSVEDAATRKLASAWRLLGRPLVVTESRLRGPVAALAATWDGGAARVEAVEDLGAGSEDARWHPVTPADPALDLLTSGSTGVPKCVRHRHRSVAAMSRAWQLTGPFDERDVSLNWMPLDHVGATVMYQVRSVFLRCHHVSARTDAFLAHPLRWLDWIDAHRVTDTWAPNFAFALVNEREAAVRGGAWDLSSLRFVGNGGEAVASRTAHQFLRLLAPHGLGGNVMQPIWGMSETCSGVTFSRLTRDDETAGVHLVDKRSLAGDLRFAAAGEAGSVPFTEVGPPVPGVRLRIADEHDRTLPEDRVGRLQVAGETLMAGYHANPEANRESFTADGWFNTGDLAFLHAGSLTITGREKDLIVVNGANYLSYEVEAVVERVPGVEVTFAAAVGIFDPERGSDRLAVFFVPTPADPEARGQAVREIRSALAREIGLQPDVVLPLERAEFPKTASGKIQRAELGRALRDGRWDDRLAAPAPDEAQEGELPAWFFEKVWRGADPARRRSVEGPVALLMEGDPAYADAVAVRVAAAGGEAVVVRRADVEAGSPEAYGRLLDELERRHGRVRNLVHAWAATPWPAASPWAASGPGDLREPLVSGLYSVLWLLQALAARGWSDAELLVVTQGGHAVREGDRVDPRKGGLGGLLRTAAAEETIRAVRHVDLEPLPAAQWADRVLAELRTDAGDVVVAWRGAERLAPRLRAVAPPEGGPGQRGIARGGLYVLTGGLGGIGFELAQHLLAAHGTRLLVAGRSRVAEADGSPAGERLAELRLLGQVRYAALDVADREALAAEVDAAEAAFGRPLDGVLHLAGEALAGWDDLERHLLRAESVEAFERMLRAKLHGTYALMHVLRERPQAELVLFSSVNGFFGGTSYGAYSAASSFLDALAERWARREGRPVRCLAWSRWADVGMNRASPTADAAGRRGFRSIDPDRGLVSFLAALGRERGYLAIGLDARSEELLPALDAEQVEPAGVVVAFTADAPDFPAERVERAVPGARCLQVAELPAGDGLDRRALLAQVERAGGAGASRRFEEPRGDLEAAVAEAFREVLAAPRVGRQDSFFDLRGNSVRAVQVMASLNARLGSDLPLQALYRHPTVRELAAALAAGEPARG